MSHHLDSDLHYLRALASSAVPYVGLLGPAARREKLLADLGDPVPALRARLRAPVGLDIGGRAPESIALAIVGEVQAALAAAAAGRSPKPHDRTAATGRVLAVSGVFAGFVAGMLGVGGGIVTVPVLEYALRFAGVPEEYRMHVAVATSLAAIIPRPSVRRARITRGARSTGSSRRAGARPWCSAPPSAVSLASHAPTAVLAGVFGSVALLIAAKMLLPLEHMRLAKDVPRGAGGALLAACIGAVSAIMGIGGGTLTVPTLNLCGYPIHRAVGTAAFFGVFISIPGTAGYLLARPPVELPWATVGFVSLVGFAIIAPGSMLTATLGARFAHALSRRRLSQAFGMFLLLVGGRMRLSRVRLSCDPGWRNPRQRVLVVHQVHRQHRQRTVDDHAGGAQQVHLRHRELATHGQHARHAFGEGALAGGMDLREGRERVVELRGRRQVVREAGSTSAGSAGP